MGVLKLPQIKMYWSNYLDIQSISSIMSRDRFYQIRNNLHIIDNLKIPSNNTDKFIKVRPFIDVIKKRMNEVPVEKIVSIDEQICPFKGKHSSKQYCKGKPYPWGIKLFLICGKSGYPYDFVIYQGSNTEISNFDRAKFGFGAATVIHLCKRLKNAGHELYFDNFFSTYQLFEVLNQLKINGTGTIRINRFNKPNFPTDAEMKKKGRRSSEQITSRDGKIVLVKWQDNKSVHLASNFVGKYDELQATRWDKNSKKYVVINQPEIVHKYNNGMGGVDLLDQKMSYYRIFIKSKKWTLRLIFHFLDLAICASYIEYKKECETFQIGKKDVLKFMDFKSYLGKCLTQVNKSKSFRKRGRPFNDSQENLSPAASRPETRPIPDVQFDEFGHFPIHEDAPFPQRCKNKDCKGRSRIKCSKCLVHLCLNKSQNCFLNFHKKNK
jgi:hypothetical protein